MNPIKGETPLKLADGREYVLVADMESLVEAEGAYGKPLPQMMKDAAQGFIGASRALLFGVLRARHPNITLRDASEMFQSDADAASEALSEAIQRGFPNAVEGKESANPPSTGKASGVSGAKPVNRQKRSGGQPRAPSR